MEKPRSIEREREVHAVLRAFIRDFHTLDDAPFQPEETDGFAFVVVGFHRPTTIDQKEIPADMSTRAYRAAVVNSMAWQVNPDIRTDQGTPAEEAMRLGVHAVCALMLTNVLASGMVQEVVEAVQAQLMRRAEVMDD